MPPGSYEVTSVSALNDFHNKVFMPNVALLAEQQLRGILVDQEILLACRDSLTERITAAMDKFLSHPQVAPHIAEYNAEVRAAWMRARPPTFLKDGKTVSKRWEAWRDREERWLDDNGFNVNSKQQLAWLLYDKLNHPVLVFTETGRPAVSRKVLPSLGEPGKLLSKYNLYKKRLGYVEAMIAKTARDGLLHPQFNTVGTVTGRLGGSSGLNLQQMPKVAEFLAALKARPGHKLVQADAEALEPVILAEFSQDRTLMKLYGPDAKQNDIYLYVGAQLPGIGESIRRWYDPENPQPEGIAAAKEHCKKERAVAKIVVLAANYNAGPLKIQETMKFAGIDLSLTEVRAIHRAYWRLFAGVKRFEEKLRDMWTVREGWIPSILGTPICVDAEYVKDIVNRFCQTSGHQVLQLWISHIDRLRKERGVTMHPWLVDNHDESIWECPEEQADAAAQIMRDALDCTNAELGMGIPIKAPPMIVGNLAEIKDPNGWKDLCAKSS